jgi:hypothetical protein
MTGGLAEIDGVDDQDAVPALEQREEIEAHGPAVDKLHRRGKDILLYQGIDRVDPYAFIGQKNVAEAQDNDTPGVVVV